MGKNKALLALDGIPLVQRVVAALAPICADLLIVANQPQPYRFLGLPIIPDIEPGYGPLMGLYSGLQAASAEWAVAVAVDMPLLSTELLRFMLDRRFGCDVVVPRAQERLHPLCALYRRPACLPAIETSLARGQRRLIAFHHQVRVCEIEESTLRRISPDLRALINVNTPVDLARARHLL